MIRLSSGSSFKGLKNGDERAVNAKYEGEKITESRTWHIYNRV